MKYSVGLGAVAEQYFHIDADDPDAAIEEAMEQHELYNNISNKFELGDALVLGVWDESGQEVVKSEL
ncbi:hypothetical protein [Mycobacteroides abscessus]|uniref:hypothetical protein n=1 Tax=Mycobacteroides abscessus TaxID=36809 RepID=UPI0018969F87